MVPYTIVMFDLDGTLTDPKAGITRSVQYALAKLGIDEPDLEHLTPFIGPPLRTTFQDVYRLTPAQAEAAVSHYREYFVHQGIYENALYEGIPQLLNSLRNVPLNIVLATSKPTVFATEILRHFDIEHFFDTVVGSYLDGTRSQKSEIIEHILGRYPDCPTTRFIMVGDRMHDIVGAQAHGIASIGVLYGYGSPDEIIAAGPTHVAQTVLQLLELLVG